MSTDRQATTLDSILSLTRAGEIRIKYLNSEIVSTKTRVVERPRESSDHGGTLASLLNRLFDIRLVSSHADCGWCYVHLA